MSRSDSTRPGFQLICLFCLCLSSLLRLGAQSTQGSIFGTITDSSGAAIPGALITVTSLEQGTKRTTKTSGSGEYRVTELEPGSYRVTVEHSGFAKAQSERIPLAIEASVRADIPLKPGSDAVTVEVTATNPLLQTDSSEVATQVTTAEIDNLPSLNRNLIELMSLGVGTTDGSLGDRQSLFSGAEVVAMGAPPSKNNFLIDGVSSNMEFSGTIAVKPPMDSASAFSTQITQFPADLGRAAGAILNMSLRSGTNQFHGSIYEYIQNNIANASNYNFTTKPLPVLPYRRNQYGARLGGPLLRDKLFFFVDWEGLQYISTTQTQFTVPTALEKTGDFSQSGFNIYDPAVTMTGVGTTRPQFSCNGVLNVICPNRISAVGKALVSYFPDPNYETRGYLQNVASTQSSNSYVLKINATLTPRDTIDAHYVQQRQLWGAEGLRPDLTGNTAFQNGINTGVSYFHIFSPQVLNIVRVAYSRFGFPITVNDSHDYVDPLGIPGWPTGAASPGFPTVALASLSQITPTEAVGGFPPDLHLWENDYQLQDTLNWQHGSHSFKFGSEADQIRTADILARTGGGIFDFDGAQTVSKVGGSVTSPQNGVPDALLGLAGATTALYNFGGTAAMRTYYIMSYAQDDWRPRKNLTINVGLRWDIFTPYREEKDRTTNFDPSTGTVLVPDTAKNYMQQLGFQNGVLPAHWTYVPRDQVYRAPNWTSFDPRLGFAFQVRSNLVWRAGFGMYHAPLESNYYLNGSLVTVSYAISTSQTSQIPVDLSVGLPTGGAAATLSAPSYAPYYMPRHLPDPYSEKWDTDIQYSPTRGTVIRLGYLGANILHIPGNVPSNLAPTVSSTLALASRVIYPQYGQISNYSECCHASYNAGTVQFVMPNFHKLLVTSNYTYSKTLGTNSVVDPINPSFDYGPMAYDVRHRFVTSFVYRLPTVGGLKLIDDVIGHWDLSGIVTLQSGKPFTVTDSGGTPLNIGTSSGSGQRPYIIRNPNLPKSKRTLLKWFDTTAFAHTYWCTGAASNQNIFTPVALVLANPSNPCYEKVSIPANARVISSTATTMSIPWGDEGSNTMRAPGIERFNIAMQRQFPLPHGSSLIFRLEETNLFNHPNWSQPAGLNFAGSEFGQITSTSIPMRQLQAAIRYNF